MSRSLADRAPSLSTLPPLPPSPPLDSLDDPEHTSDGLSEVETLQDPPLEISADVISYSLSACGNSTSSSKEHFKTATQLISFLEIQSSGGRESAAQEVYLLIEDISDDVIRILKNHIGFQPGTAAEYSSGRVNNSAQGDAAKLHADRLSSTLFDRARPNEIQELLTWWKLFSHSRAGYGRESEALRENNADTRRIVVPHFTVHISDTLRETSYNGPEVGVRTLLSSLRQRQPENKGGLHGLLGPKPGLEISTKVHKLDCFTYRPHQVITEVTHDTWGAAGEERVSFSQLWKGSTKFCKLSFKQMTR
jgi:hypothetical protein